MDNLNKMSTPFVKDLLVAIGKTIFWIVFDVVLFIPIILLGFLSAALSANETPFLESFFEAVIKPFRDFWINFKNIFYIIKNRNNY